MRHVPWIVAVAGWVAASGCSLALFDDPVVEDADDGGADDGDVPVDAETEAEADAEPDAEADVEPDAEADAEVDVEADGEAETSPECGNGVHEDGEECDDGNVMNGDGCDDDCRFSCHEDVECREDPDDPCTNNFCRPEEDGLRSCDWTANEGAICDDGDDCTENDVCNAEGFCEPGVPICECPSGMDEDCAPFENGDLCDGTLVCDPTTRRCVVDPATVVVCPTDEPCVTFSCVPETGLCPPGPRTAGTACDDGAFCNGEDLCDGSGNCVSSGDPCPETCRTCDERFDRCNVASGCWIDGACWADGAPNPASPCQYCNVANPLDWSNHAAGHSCDDGAFCNGADACDGAGSCVSAGSPCTASCLIGCNETRDICTPRATSCWIDETCYANGDPNPANQCQHCQTILDPNGWSNLADFSGCSLRTVPDYTYDICSSGHCVSPGACGTASCNAPGPNFPLPDTGQRRCSNDTAVITCPDDPASGTCFSTPYCGQDAQYGWDATHLPTVRYDRDVVSVPREPVVRDRVTGLVWQGCNAELTGADCTGGVQAATTWEGALDYCNGLSWGGYTDWGLPSPYELMTILDYDRGTGAYINPTAFPGTIAAAHWTSSTSASDGTRGHTVSFYDGRIGDVPKSSATRVRCVRHLATTVPVRFVRSDPVPAEFVVADNVTGLVWQGCQAGLRGDNCAVGTALGRNWVEALAYCESLVWGGRDDWYLPNIFELMSISDDRLPSPNVVPDAFPGTGNVLESSSTWNTQRVEYVYTASHNRFAADAYQKTLATRRFRCVRLAP